MRSAIDYAAVMTDDELSEGLFLRVSKADKQLLETLSGRLPLKPAAIARIALRIGLAEIDRDPARIFAAGTMKKGSKR